MLNNTIYKQIIGMIALGCAVSAYAGVNTYIWNNSTGDLDFNHSANWSSAPTSGNNYVNIGSPESEQAVLTNGETLNFAGIRLGFSGSNGELEQTGGVLNASSVGHGASRLGSDNTTGIYRMSGGTAKINALQLGMGRGDSEGQVILSGGDLTVSGTVAHYSIRLGDTERRAIGVFEISGGSLQTRTDVRVSEYGTFAVLGSQASEVRIGHYGDGDGAWFQEAGGVLKCRIDAAGVTTILIDDIGDPSDGDGNVLFAKGALLDVGFLSTAQEGEWDVMHWDGTLVDYGLQFASEVDQTIWSFSFVDTDASGAPDTLRVRAGNNQPTLAISKSKLTVDVMFDNAMVLQRDLEVPIWGKAPKGSIVTIKLDGQTVASATADASGNWMAKIAAHPGDGGLPHTITVQSSGEPEIVLTDVVFGDVYICSGQSNMDRTLTGLMLGADIVKADDPQIRMIKVAHSKSNKPLDDPKIEYTWTRCHSAIAGEFTATGYFTAKKIQSVTGQPVGLLYSAWGGRPIKEFIRAEGMALVPELAGVEHDIENRVQTYYYSIHNAMIAPMAPYAVRGILWYQGEADSGRMGADLYRMHQLALIRGWRDLWKQDTLSFYFAQLPNYDMKADWPRFREGQQRFLSELDTGMAVTIDVGNDRDIHPTNKFDVGNRLGTLALANDLGYDLPYSSPFFKAESVQGDTMQISFDFVDGGLMVATKDDRNLPLETDSPLQNFEVAGADKQFHAADAQIQGNTVWVSSPNVNTPVYVRYCWDNTPDGPNKLYDRAGFPVSPFRNYTDYVLKVSGGEGSANAVEAEAVLTISAPSEKDGKSFDRWIGGGGAVTDPTAHETKVSIPRHDLYLVPAYR